MNAFILFCYLVAIGSWVWIALLVFAHVRRGEEKW